MIIAAEERFGFPVPESYRTFLSEHNGGELKDENSFFQIRIKDKNIGDGLIELLSLEMIEARYSFYVSQFDEEGYPNFLHKLMLQIADTHDAGGIFIGYTPENNGHIFWINYVSYDDNLMPIKLADNFEDFLSMLTSYKQLYSSNL